MGTGHKLWPDTEDQHIMSKLPMKTKLNSLIFQIREINVMLDSDLAELYETDTKKLKQQVRYQN